MLITNEKWQGTDHLILGIQTDPQGVDARALDNAKYWGPKRAKSITITLVNNEVDAETGRWKNGYPLAVVQYYTGVNEGEIRIK